MAGMFEQKQHISHHLPPADNGSSAGCDLRLNLDPFSTSKSLDACDTIANEAPITCSLTGGPADGNAQVKIYANNKTIKSCLNLGPIVCNNHPMHTLQALMEGHQTSIENGTVARLGSDRESGFQVASAGKNVPASFAEKKETMNLWLSYYLFLLKFRTFEADGNRQSIRWCLLLPV